MSSKKNQTPTRITEPAEDSAAPAPEAKNPTKAAVDALIQALGHDPEEVASLEVTARHVRVYGKDRSLRSHRLEETA